MTSGMLTKYYSSKVTVAVFFCPVINKKTKARERNGERWREKKNGWQDAFRLRQEDRPIYYITLVKF